MSGIESTKLSMITYVKKSFLTISIASEYLENSFRISNDSEIREVKLMMMTMMMTVMTMMLY